METKAKIKVIKRAERPVKPVQRAAQKKSSAKSHARDVVATVSGWVNEFQQKRREDARSAFDQLFRATPDAA